MKKITLGVSLFSFTGEYINGQFTLEDCIRTASEIGAECFEMVGAQMLPTYPYITEEYAREFKAMCDGYGIPMTSYGANMDRGMLPDRDLTEDEMLRACINDLRTAGKLGAGMMRVQYMTPPSVMKRLAPYAEAYGIHCGIEIHNPETPSSPTMQAYREVYDQVGSRYLGFVVDFGSFANGPNKPSIDRALANGASQEALDYAISSCYDKVPREEVREGLLKMGANAAAMGAFEDMYAFLTFSREPDFAGLKAIVPYISYCHGKFHYISEDLVEPAIPYPEILKTLVDAGYSGTIVSENEGHHAGKTVEMTRRHLEMQRKILAAL